MRFDQIITPPIPLEILDEVRMGASDLDQFANSPDAQGIQAGFEAELCFGGRGSDDGDEDYDVEEDDSYDTRPHSISEICDFFDDGNYNSSSDIDRLRDKLNENYFEWRSEQVYEQWHEVEEEVVKEYIESNDFEFDTEIENYLRDELELTDEEIKAAIEAGKQYSKFTKLAQQTDAKENSTAMSNYAEASDHVNELLDEKVKESVSEQDRNYDNAREQWEEDQFENSDYGEREWLSENINWMTEIPRKYGVMWPHYNYISNENGNSFDVYQAQELADSLSSDLDIRVEASSGYHSTEREPGLWIIEEDSSLEADYGDMPCEIVSPPMPLEECLNKMDTFFAWAKSENANTNESTGLHVGVSVPFAGGDVDYVKLALFLGDKYVLQQFDRLGNFYCKNAIDKIKLTSTERVPDAFALMRAGLIELASKTLKQQGGHGKYTSINTKGSYIEFRSMGGDYINKLPEIKSMVKRYAYAMYIASRPDLYRDEYAKKLYKLIVKSGDQDTIKLFTEFNTGGISKEQLKQYLKSRELERQQIKGAGTKKYWWNVAAGSRRIEVVAKNKPEAILTARREMNWDAEDYPDSVLKVSVLRPFDENTVAGDSHRRLEQRRNQPF